MDTQRPLAVVTGASSGIGYELAIQFARNGYDLLIVSGSEAITRAAAQLQDFGVTVEAYRHDLTQESEVDAFCMRIRATGRPVAAAALNAGVGVGGKFFETDLCKEMDLIKLNVVSTVHVAKHLVQYMDEIGHGGRILFTASIAGAAPGPFEAVYAASKAFVLSFAQALHYELKEKGIHVTALMPGPTETNFFHRADMDDTKVGVSQKDDPAQVAEQGFQALMDGKDHVVAGAMMNHVMAADLVPDRVKIAMHADMAKPGGASEKQGGPDR